MDEGLVGREILLVLGGALSLAVYMLVAHPDRRRQARARAPREELPEHLRVLYSFADDWNGETTRAWAGRWPDGEARVWDVTLFGARALDGLRAVELGNARYFELGPDARACERVLSPLARKLLARFRGEFERSRPVAVARPRAVREGAWVTWLSSERHIHHVCHWFLDEMVKVARDARVTPSLLVDWDEGFALCVRMPFARELSALEGLAHDSPGLEVAFSAEEVVVKLSVACARSRLTDARVRSEGFKVSTRGKPGGRRSAS
jgi:hypothetical protein